MKLTFTNENLKLLWADAEKQWPNGTRPTYGQEENPERGFWIVGDQGVYLMHNGVFPDGEKAVVIYAEECNPETCEDWWDIKSATFGGDDGCDFIEMAPVKQALDRNGWLEFEFTADAMTMNTVWTKGKVN